MMRFKNLAAIVAIFVCFATALASPQATPKPGPKAFGDSEFRLGPDDVIQIFVWKQAELSTEPVVRPDGNISIPLIGELRASGKTCVELEGEIGKRLSEYVVDPVVNVIVKQVNSAKVSVLGEVKEPGVYPIKDRATVIDAVAYAGGFTEYAKRNKVTVIRNTPSGVSKRIVLNVDELIKGSRELMFYILPYDTIYVQ
jgi:polysaccharide export outer membrane protein